MREQRLIDANGMNPFDICEKSCVDGVATLRGWVALQPTIEAEALPIVQELREKLARYEKAEQEGRLVELPCKVGDTVWIFCKYGLRKASVTWIIQDYSGSWRIDVETYVSTLHRIRFEIKISDFGKTVFLSREDAEAVLKERRGINYAE